jgi:hypothetical protein
LARKEKIIIFNKKRLNGEMKYRDQSSGNRLMMSRLSFVGMKTSLSGGRIIYYELYEIYLALKDKKSQ